MTRHPCHGMTKAKVRVFERIAINQPPMADCRTIAALIERGVVERLPMKQIGADIFGAIMVPDYRVPIAVHWQWCEWCSEQPDIEAA